ncbi:MAG: LysR family transcriptional regulator [Xanthomonadales bacterium]|nr:LysR family transcriptional regulator [Xanthomonadales bacterium]
MVGADMARFNYNHLRYFWAVAHEGSLTRSAERLNVSQSTLSVQIRKLEQRLGQDLFERRGRRLELTEAGRIALDHADAIFAAGDELVGTLSQSGTARKALRVGSLATLSRNFQIDFLRPMLQRSDVEVVLRSGSAGNLLQALDTLQLDMVLVNEAPATDAITPWIIHRVAEQHLSLVGLPEFADKGPDLAKLLQHHPVILPTRENSIRAGFDALLDRMALRPNIAAEVDDMAMIRLLAREGIGLAVVPPIVIKDELVTGRLSEIVPIPDLVETFYAVTVKRRFPNLLVNELLQAARSELG